MSLNWNMTKVKDLEELHSDDKEWQRSESIIWATIAIDMGEITEENWKEFYARLHLWELMGGFEATKPADVHRRIGLSVNVLTEPRSKWLKRVVGRHLDDFAAGAVSDIGNLETEGAEQ